MPQSDKLKSNVLPLDQDDSEQKFIA